MSILFSLTLIVLDDFSLLATAFLLELRKDALVALERFDRLVFRVWVEVGGVERVLDFGHVPA